MPLLRLAFACALLLPGAAAQEMGGEYDYSNYQAGMEAAPQVVAGDGRARRQGVLMNFACGALGYAANGMLNRAHGKKVMKKAQAEKDHLISVLTVKKMENQQLQYVVQQYEYQIHELQRALYDSEAEGLQRDYEEFKAPDQNGDDVISRQEFHTYIRNYMKAYPQIPESDYPTFDDFDTKSDGYVTFAEWQEYMKLQKEQEKKDKAMGTYQQPQNQQQRQAMQGLYETANQGNSFQNLYEQIKAAQRGQTQMQR